MRQVLLAIPILLLLSITLPVYCDDTTLLERIDRLEAENQELRSLIESMGKKLDSLTKERSESIPHVHAPPQSEPEEVEEELDELSPWLPSVDGETFRFGGRFQAEFFDPQQETLLPSARTSNPGGSFQVDEFRLKVDADFKNDIRFHGEFDAVNETDGSRLVEAYVDVEDLPFSSELRVGIQPLFYRPGRFTESIPLPGIATWFERDLGVTWTGSYDPVYMHAALMNGHTLDTRRLGEDDSARAISTDSTNTDVDGAKDIALGLGLDLDFDDWGRLDVLGFASAGELSEDDIFFLQTAVPGYGQSFADRMERAGINVDYKIDEWDFFAQAIASRDGELERFSWFAEASYKFEFDGMKYLDEIRPLVRYSQIDLNLLELPFSTNGSLTWDRQQWLMALIMQITRNVNFRSEYAFNLEDTGGPDAQNNEMLFQLEVEF